jgi:LysM repeat protein
MNNTVAQGSQQAQILGWYTGPNGQPIANNSSTTVGAQTSNNGGNAVSIPTANISSLRSQMANGSITPAQAKAQLQQSIGTNTENEQNAFAAALPQLFAPMTINKGGQIMNLNNDGSVTIQSTTNNNSVTTGSGTQTSTSYQTPGQATTQTVKSGDTLSQIAASNGMTLSALEALNPQITNPNLIQPGQSINLSSASSTSSTGNTGTSNPLASNYKTASAYQAALVAAGWNPTAAATQATNAQTNGYLTASADPATTGSTTGNTGTSSKGTTGNTGATTGVNGTSGPQTTSTGNSTLDAGVQSAVNYVTDAIMKGYPINPSLTPANIASMLPQFIQETLANTEPQLAQDLQQTFTQAGQTIQSLAASYIASQTATTNQYQSQLNQIMQGAPTPGQSQAEQLLTLGTNQSLASLDASMSQQIGSTAQNAGAKLGTGGQALQSGLAANGIVGANGINGYSASDLTLPGLTSKTVGTGGGFGSQYSGSTQANDLLNFQYNPSVYTSGSLPQAFSTAFSQGLSQNIGNYLTSSANTGNRTL